MAPGEGTTRAGMCRGNGVARGDCVHKSDPASIRAKPASVYVIFQGLQGLTSTDACCHAQVGTICTNMAPRMVRNVVQREAWGQQLSQTLGKGHKQAGGKSRCVPFEPMCGSAHAHPCQTTP